MPLAAKRTFRLGLTVSLALVIGYGMGLSMPFLPALFALMLTVPPGPPMPAGKLLALVFAVMLILGLGLLLIRPLEYYPLTAVLLVICGVFLASYLSVNLGKGGPATLLIVALVLISSIGTRSWAAAVLVIQSLAIGVVLAIVCQWTVYPLLENWNWNHGHQRRQTRCRLGMDSRKAATADPGGQRQ